MGWLPFSSGAKPGPTPSSDGGFIAPDRTERAMCWEARDGYYACLDKQQIVDPITNAKQATDACGSQEKDFEKNCAQSWVRRLSLGTPFSPYRKRLGTCPVWEALRWLQC